ncbi:MAG: porin family protein [Chlamydiales bacterium]|nr:porin family protein [Chlamydiales bacterium]
MKRVVLYLAIIVCCVAGKASAQYLPYGDPCCNFNCCSEWYGVVGAGYAWSMKTGIDNPDPSYWDFSNEGYNADLKESPFFYIGFGRQVCGLDFDLTYSYYETFHYQKFQTGVSPTPGFTGEARTRFFDLNHQNLLFSIGYTPTWECLCWEFCDIRVRPHFGAGIGLGISHIDNFRTVSYVTLGEEEELGFGSTTSIGNRVRNTSFAWRVLASLRFSLPCALTLDVGYRYYDGGCFEGPSRIAINAAEFEGRLDSGKPWKGRLKTNELFLNLIFSF